MSYCVAVKKGRSLVKDSAVLTVGVLIANAFNLLFQVIMGRLFSADEFGVLSALLGVFNMLLLPLGVVALAITHSVSELDGAGRRGDISRILKSWTLRLGLVGLLLNGLIWLNPTVVADWFQLNRLAPVYVFGFVLFGTLIRPVFFASLRGIELFYAWSGGNLVQSVVRLLGGLVFVISVGAYAGWGLLGHGLGVFVGLAFACLALRKKLKGEVASGLPLPMMGSYMAQSIGVMSGLSLFLVGDVVLVRRYFPDVSGLYAYASILGHLILIVPQSICGALFPKVVKAAAAERIILYRNAARSTLGAAVLLCAGVCVFGRLLLWLLFGGDAISEESVRWLRLIALSLIPISLLQYTIQFSLAVKQFDWLWLVLVASVGLIVLLEMEVIISPDGLIILLAVMALLLAVFFDILGRRLLRRKFRIS